MLEPEIYILFFTIFEFESGVQYSQSSQRCQQLVLPSKLTITDACNGSVRLVRYSHAVNRCSSKNVSRRWSNVAGREDCNSNTRRSQRLTALISLAAAASLESDRIRDAAGLTSRDSCVLRVSISLRPKFRIAGVKAICWSIAGALDEPCRGNMGSRGWCLLQSRLGFSGGE